MTDRRVLRTRALLQNALRVMIIEKGYEETTVQDIIDRAGVSRSTFYAHFADKETLLVSGLDDLRRMLMQQRPQASGGYGKSGRRGFAFCVPMLEHAREHLPLYRAMVGKRSGAVVMGRIAAIIAEVVAHELEAMGISRSDPRRDLVVEHTAGSFMSVLRWWLEQGAKLSPMDVDEIFTGLVMDGVGARIGAAGHKEQVTPAGVRSRMGERR